MVILNTEVETEEKPDYPWEEAAYCVCSRVLEQEGFPYDVVANDGDHNITLVNEVEKASYLDRYLAAIK